MDPEEPAGRALGTGYKYVSMGITFAGGIVMFMGLGWLLDRWLGTLPLLLITGALGGSVLSFIWVYQRLKQDEIRYEAEHGGARAHGRPGASRGPTEAGGDSDEAGRRPGDSAVRPPDQGSE